MEKFTELKEKIMTAAQIKSYADKIRSMQDLSELVDLCQKDAQMALFCGVRCDTSPDIMRRDVSEQWNVCRKNMTK